MSATRHWSKFWWQDWMRDPGLSFCSLAAQGLWMRLLCLAHEGDPYGHVTFGGTPITNEEVGMLCGITTRKATSLLAELEKHRVYSKTDDGVMYCRRMVRDHKVSTAMRETARLGGNPDIIRGTVPKENRSRNFKRSDAPRKTQRIFDRTNGRCHWCKTILQREHPGPDFFQVDHVIAIRDGGTNDENNLVASCSVCNLKRSRHQDPTVTGRISDPNHQEAESESESESVPTGRKNDGRDPIPMMPSRSDPPHKWEHLGDSTEVDEDGKRHPVVGGYYLDTVANLVCEAAGIDNVHWRGDWRPVAEWLRSKLLPDTVILPAIRAVAARPGYDPRSIRSLAYFDAAVREQGGGGQSRARKA